MEEATEKLSLTMCPSPIGTLVLAAAIVASTGLVIDLTPGTLASLVLPHFPEAMQSMLSSWHPVAVGLALDLLFIVLLFSVWNFRYVEIDPEKQTVQVRLCFGFVPVITRRYRFSEIRYVDLKYTASTMISALLSGRYRYMWGDESDVGSFSLILLLEDRTPVLIARGWSEDRLRKIAERVSRITGKRIG